MSAKEKADSDRAIAAAVTELVSHGGNEKDVKQLIDQFQKATEEKESETDARTIPD